MGRAVRWEAGGDTGGPAAGERRAGREGARLHTPRVSLLVPAQRRRARSQVRVLLKYVRVLGVPLASHERAPAPWAVDCPAAIQAGLLLLHLRLAVAGHVQRGVVVAAVLYEAQLLTVRLRAGIGPLGERGRPWPPSAPPAARFPLTWPVTLNKSLNCSFPLCQALHREPRTNATFSTAQLLSLNNSIDPLTKQACGTS